MTINVRQDFGCVTRMVILASAPFVIAAVVMGVDRITYEVVKDIVSAIFAAATIVVAFLGLATWKKQIKGQKEFNTAYELNYSFLKLRDAIRAVRNPMIWPAESRQAALRSKEENPDKTQDELGKEDGQADVYNMRWESVTRAATEIEAHLLAAEVLWGKDVVALRDPLKEKVFELNMALKQKFNPEFRTSKYGEVHAIIYDQSNGPNDQDAFTREVNQAIEDIASYLRGKMT